MVNKCCVPKCRSNYDNEKEKVAVFRFPKDPLRSKVWFNKIPRKQWKLGNNSVFCVKHFKEKFVIVPFSKDGRFKLTPDAVPSIFFTNASHPPAADNKITSRVSPEIRRQKREDEFNSNNEKWLNEDHISNFHSFCEKIPHHISSPWSWVIFSEDCKQVVIYRLNRETINNRLQVKVSIEISEDLSVKLWVDEGV